MLYGEIIVHKGSREKLGVVVNLELALKVG